MLRVWVLACAVAVIGQSAQACRLALVLGMDVSNSVDADEDALQRNGLAAALLAPAVRDAFFMTDDPVALAVFEWSGRHHQRMMQDWVLIDSPATLEKCGFKYRHNTQFLLRISNENRIRAWVFCWPVGPSAAVFNADYRFVRRRGQQ